MVEGKVVQRKSGRAHLSLLEPTSAASFTPLQIRGLITLAALFNDTVHISDTQLGDNPHLLAEHFRRDSHGLLAHLRQLAENRSLRVLLRDSFYLSDRDRTIECESFADVYTAWIEQAMPGAWVVPIQNDDRLSYYRQWDKIIESANIAERYSYPRLKRDFMVRVREANIISRLPPEQVPESLHHDYKLLLSRDWFSYSDIYSLLNRHAIEGRDYLAQTHGIYDAVCYADLCTADLVSSQIDPHTALGHRGDSVVGLRSSLDDASDYLLAKLDLPGLSLLSQLSVDDILAIRERGRPLFEQVNYARLLDEENILGLRRDFIARLSQYWDEICEYIAVRYPHAAKERTQVGIFAASHLPTLSRWYKQALSFGISLGINAIPIASLRDLTANYRAQLFGLFDLHLVAFKPSKGLRSLRKALPSRSWLSSLALERTKGISQSSSQDHLKMERSDERQ